MSFTDDVEYIRRSNGSRPGPGRGVRVPADLSARIRAGLSEVDFAIRHEPYFAAVDLARAVAGDMPIEAVPNLSRRAQGGGEVVAAPEVFETDLDRLPIPDVDMLPRGVDYFNPIVTRLPYITTTTSWGCPGKCAFCTAPAFDGPKVRFKTAGYVVRELAYYQEKGFRRSISGTTPFS